MSIDTIVIIIIVWTVLIFLLGFAFGEVNGSENAREERLKKIHEKRFGKDED